MLDMNLQLAVTAFAELEKIVRLVPRTAEFVRYVEIPPAMEMRIV
jgi:hypothetical protein